MTEDQRLSAPPPRTAAELPPDERYVGGFEGIAAAPFSDQIRAALWTPIDPDQVEIKPDGIVFLPGVFYRDRLTTAFGAGGWAIAPRGPIRTRVQGSAELVIYHGALWALGRFVSEAVGQCLYYTSNKGMTYADAAEGARTDCITRCCKDLGIARDLWDPGWRDEWKRKYARQELNSKGEMAWVRRPRAQRMTSGTTASASAPSVASAPVTSVAPAAQAAEPAAPANDVSPAPSPPEPLKHAKDSGGAVRAEVAGAIVGKVLEIFPGATVMEGDTGEAPSEADLDTMRAKLKSIRWTRQWTDTWFKSRFGVGANAVTKRQFRTAMELLEAAGGPALADNPRYSAALEKATSEGRCK